MAAENGQRHSLMPVYVEEPEDGLDLGELLAGIVRYRWVVLGVWSLVVAGALAYYMLTPPSFRSEALLAPTSQEKDAGIPGALTGLTGLIGVGLGSSTDLNVAIATLRSRAFLGDFISDENLLPVLFADSWDADAGRWQTDDPEDIPGIQDGVAYFADEILAVVEDRVSGLVTLRITWTDPQTAAEWAEQLILRVNERLRARDLKESESRLQFLQDRIRREQYLEIRQAISSLIEDEIKKSMLAQVDSEYAFKVIDPPIAPSRRYAPKLRVILLVAVAGGLALGVLLAGLLSVLREQRPQQKPVQR